MISFGCIYTRASAVLSPALVLVLVALVPSIAQLLLTTHKSRLLRI